MKLPHIALSSLCLALSLAQVGCTGYYATGYSPGPGYYAPSYPVATWGGTGFYGGSYYRGPGWNNNYYRHGSWGGGSGNVNGWRGGSASWGGGSGSWHGARGGSGSWHR